MIEKVKLLLKNYDEELLNFCVKETENYIRNYCNIDKIPAAAEGIAVEMAIHLYKNFGERDVKSIRRGDFSVTYEGKGFEKRLSVFRKFRW